MILWHYTSIDVLESIFSKELPTLRATHIHHLNDSSELKHGLQAFCDILKRENNSNQNVNAALDSLLSESTDPQIYSFSLSESENSLYQWLAYGPSHGGVSLGFEFSEIDIGEQQVITLPLPDTKESEKQVQIPQFRKCHYFKNIDRFPDGCFEMKKDKTLEVNLLTNAMFLKHEAFHFEEERRLFFHLMPSNPNQVPIEYNHEKPYVNFHFQKKILKYIFISPRGDKSLTKKAAEKLLAEKSLGHVEIKVSDIPFRE